MKVLFCTMRYNWHYIFITSNKITASLFSVWGFVTLVTPTDIMLNCIDNVVMRMIVAVFILMVIYFAIVIGVTIYTKQRKQVKIRLSQHFYVLSLMLQMQSASRECTKRSGLKAELKAESQSDLLQAKPKQTHLLHRPQKQGPGQVHKREDFVHTVATFCKREYCEAE